MKSWLSQIRKEVPGHRPEEHILEAAEAAVLMAITDLEQDPHIVLTKRADHLSSHPGEVAFPGGKRDHDDPNIIYTALRESHEEVLLLPDSVEVVGPLPPSVSKMGLKVVPIVGIIPHQTQLVPSEHEIASIFQVPIRYFLENPVQEFTEREFQGVRYKVPCYRYDGYVIWGLTAYFITDSFNKLFGAGIDMSLPLPILTSGQ